MPLDWLRDTDAMHNKIDARDNGLSPEEEEELLFEGPEPEDPFADPF